MFEQLFGNVFGSQEGPQRGNGGCDSTAFLTELAEKSSVMAVYRDLQAEFGGNGGPTMQSVDANSLKKSGNNHFVTGRYCDAAEAYKRALELSPGDCRLYTNVALALIRCGRYEEAVSYAHGATIVDPTWSKGFAYLATAYAHLGYTDVAHYYAEFCMRPFGDDAAIQCQQAITRSIAGKLDPSMYRTTDTSDLQMTLNRFSDSYMNADQIIFLFVHLDFHVSCKDQNHMTHVGSKLRSTGFLRRLFREIPLTSGIINQSNDLLSLSPEDAHLLSAVLRITGFASCGSPQACTTLLSCQEFLFFLSCACRQIVTGNFLRAILADPERYSFHRLVVDNLLRTICTATSQGGPFNRFLRPIDPFRNFSWHTKLLGVWLSLFPPVKNADIMCHLIVSLSKICEENSSYLDELNHIPKRDAIGLFSLLATISQVYVECCIHPATGNSIQLDLLLVFWLFLTKDPRSVAICVQTPLVWTFFANRLHSVVNNKNSSSLSGEIWFILEILCNMASFLQKNPSADNCFENGPWFGLIVSACSDAAWRKSKHHAFIRSALMLAARLASISTMFTDNFAYKVTYTRLVRLASCGEPDVDTPALHCIGVLLGRTCHAESIREITASSHFSEYIAKTMSSIAHAVNHRSALANDSKLCLYFLLKDNGNEEVMQGARNALLAELKKSPHNCDTFVKKLQGDMSVGVNSQPKKKSRDRDVMRTGMFSEPLPDDVTLDEAKALSLKLLDAITQRVDELTNVIKAVQ